jgi:hypothetical protein
MCCLRIVPANNALKPRLLAQTRLSSSSSSSVPVFEGGFARYHLVGRSPRSFRFEASDLLKVNRLRETLGPLIPSQPTQRRCCDSAEFFVDLEKGPSMLGAIEPNQLIVYPSQSSSELPPEIKRLITWRNCAARSIAGRHSLSVP